MGSPYYGSLSEFKFLNGHPVIIEPRGSMVEGLGSDSEATGDKSLGFRREGPKL